MKLADKIIRLRKQKGWSQEELAERLEVSRQSVSKWESGLSNPDLDKIISLSDLFGVSTDELLKDELQGVTEARKSKVGETAEGQEQTEMIPLRRVEKAEAERYLQTVRLLSWRFALGVMLCILSPICLICLAGAADAGMLGEGLAVGIGLGVLLAFVAVAVAIFIPNGMRLSEFDYLEKESICLSETLSQEIGKRHSQFAPKHRLFVTVGCVICILGAVPLLVLSCIQGENALAVVL
ncbi:MAG: helix-turn-helix transcriptional regulator, partial [Clostridia bacterium]|nr:helix-turn-helix transcriptional regulator [Clostridia bacterium]